MPRPRLVRAALLGGALLALAGGCSRAADADDAFGARVRAYLLKHPEVLEEALQKLEAQKSERADAAAAEGIARNKAKLENDPEDFVANPAGRRTVVEFFDYKCPYCKTSADQVVKLIKDHPDVRFVFKEFPILSDTSSHAAVDQLIARGQGRYLDLFQTLMDEPALEDEKTEAAFKKAGVDLKRLDTPEARAAAEKHLAANRALAHEVGVEGTPAFIVNGKRIDGWQPDEVEAGLAAEGRGAKAGS